MSGAAISARGLEKRFGAVAALADVDLEVRAGSALAVVGPNGAGKSTLLRLLAGLARPSAGSVRIAGRPASHRAVRAGVGYVGHASLLYGELTARENLVFTGRLYGVARPWERADALLAELGLAELAARPVREFSRGSVQRLSIARALVHEPSIVLLDEPFAGLDAAAARRLVHRLQRLRDTGRALVLVTHDLARACELADAALVLARGRVLRALSGATLAPETLERAHAAAVDAT